MLIQLSIRDIVLIERLDIDFASGLSVLTGETGAGKSILLDSLSLALGARGDGSLVRSGADQGQVTAVFEPEVDHPVRAVLSENAIDAEGGVILRRVHPCGEDNKHDFGIAMWERCIQLANALRRTTCDMIGNKDTRVVSVNN